MKRIISLIVMVAMIFVSIPGFASNEESEKMQQVLILVKDKIEIPTELSEFSGNVSEYNNKVTYRFEWTTSDYEKNMSVTSDDKGRIINYHQNTFKLSDKRISNVSKAQLVEFAYNFLYKTVPETFVSDNDLLVFDKNSYSASGSLLYSIGFERIVDGIPVKNNYANVSVAVVDDQMFVRSMNINYDYDASFDEPGKDIDNYVEKYKQLFPVELIYRNEYKPYTKMNEPRYQPELIYQIKDNEIGYMDSSTGEIIKEDKIDYYYSKNEVYEGTFDSMNSASGSGGSSLTPQEIAELEKIDGLLGTDDIEIIIKNIPFVNLTDEFEMTSNRLYKDYYGKYYYNIKYEQHKNDYHNYINVSVDAKSGELISLSSNIGKYDSERVLSDAEKQQAENRITEFLNVVAKEKFSCVQIDDNNNYGGNVRNNYIRIVNDVRYLDNGISVTYNVDENVITYYNCNFIDSEFADPKQAVGEIKAYENIVEYAPVVPVFVKSGGVYKKVFTLQKTTNITVDAISGEIKNKDAEFDYDYTDISGHWVEKAANKLAENQIGIKGNELKPETEITQAELLYLLGDSIYGKYYSEYSIDQLYENLIRNGIITEQEKNPNAFVNREDAFVFVIRMAGYEKIAKLENIFKVSYADGSKLSKGKIGYAAILSGLGIICGDGGNLRPQDKLTRAEAITVVYNYLLSY